VPGNGDEQRGLGVRLVFFEVNDRQNAGTGVTGGAGGWVSPYDLQAHELLAQIDQMMGKTAEAAKEQRVMEELDEWQKAAAQGD
jgi:hypothetical protein